MAGNTFGRLFTVTSFGESHGAALGCVVDGCPPGLELSEADLQADVDRRRPGTSQYTSQRRESDTVRILSGVFEGRTTGTPIGLLVENEDQRSRDYHKIKDRFRPGHADYTYQQKYGFRDYRGGGRSSARETVMRVAAGAVARKYLHARLGVRIHGYLAQMGPLVLEPKDLAGVHTNPFFCPDPDRIKELEDFIWRMREAGDSIGARVTVIAAGVPPGLGEPVFERLDADLASAMMGINAVKGVEIGDGFKAVEQRGSEHRDELTPAGFKSNHAGGVLGGISSGQDIVVSLALKPTSSIVVPGATIDLEGAACEIATTGRHDPCVGFRATPIAEAMMALVLMDHYLRYRAQCADVVSPTPVITRGAIAGGAIARGAPAGGALAWGAPAGGGGALAGGAPAEGTSAQGTSAQGTSAHGTSAHGTSAHGTSVQGTSVQGTSVQGTSVQGTSAQGTSAQGTSAQGTSAQGTPALGAAAQGTSAQGAPAGGALAEGALTGAAAAGGAPDRDATT